MNATPMPAAIRIQFLGQVCIFRDGVEIVVNDKKAILLMFVLATKGATNRQQMASLLWPPEFDIPSPETGVFGGRCPYESRIYARFSRVACSGNYVTYL